MNPIDTSILIGVHGMEVVWVAVSEASNNNNKKDFGGKNYKIFLRKMV